MPERLAALGCFALVACSSGEPGARAGSLRVEWTGADTGKLAAPAVAEWCDSLRLLEVRAMHGDTGIALVLYPLDSAKPGTYAILPPQRADSSRPAAAAALRWFGETSISGFRGDSGVVTLEAMGAGATSGRFTGHLRSATEGGRLAVAGTFSGLTVRPAHRSCAGRPDDTAPADTADALEEEPPGDESPPPGETDSGSRQG